MKNYPHHTAFVILFLIGSLYLMGCRDDDPTASVFSYDASAHIYGTFGNTDDQFWEVAIDPATGRYSKLLPSEQTLSSGLSPRTGAFELTAFARNERIYATVSSSVGPKTLKIQDLATFQVTEIALRDTVLGESVIFPQLLRFGASQDEVFLLDTDNSIWQINLDSRVVRKVRAAIPLADGRYVCNYFYRASKGHFLVMTNDVALNAYTADRLLLINPALPDATATLSDIPIASGFGFVQHPVEQQVIYYIQRPRSNKGFRLMKIEMATSGIEVTEVSQTDLPIDNLAVYLQTIHTASNTYIIRSGPATLDNPSNTLYSIDLNTGELLRGVALPDAGFLLKLAGE